MKDLEKRNSTLTSIKGIYFEEFPFLDKGWLRGWNNEDLTRDDLCFIEVSHIDLDVLEAIPYYDDYSLRLRRIYIIDKNGDLVDDLNYGRCVRKPTFSIFRPSTWGKIWMPGISVKQAFMRLENNRLNDVSYIVILSGSLINFYVEIFKLPKHFSLVEWVEKEKQRIRETIHQQNALYA